MFFKNKKNQYGHTAEILVREGYSDSYMAALDNVLQNVSKASDIAEGYCYKACAHLFRGELDSAYDRFAEINKRSLPVIISQSYAANYLLCLFLLNKFREADELYESCNNILLEDNNLLMRRSVGIHQFIRGNFDASLTVFIKAGKEAGRLQDSSASMLMLDICIVRTLVKLDMYPQAADYCSAFSRYDNLDKLGDIVRKLKKNVFDNVSNEKKVKMIKGRKK